MRRTERLNKETKNWDCVEFQELKDGDVFRLFDNEERYINKADGNNVWIAKGIPYLNNDNIWTVDTIY